jgi:hypothetical protein
MVFPVQQSRSCCFPTFCLSGPGSSRGAPMQCRPPPFSHAFFSGDSGGMSEEGCHLVAKPNRNFAQRELVASPPCASAHDGRAPLVLLSLPRKKSSKEPSARAPAPQQKRAAKRPGSQPSQRGWCVGYERRKRPRCSMLSSCSRWLRSAPISYVQRCIYALAGDSTQHTSTPPSNMHPCSHTDMSNGALPQ